MTQQMFKSDPQIIAEARRELRDIDLACKHLDALVTICRTRLDGMGEFDLVKGPWERGYIGFTSDRAEQDVLRVRVAQRLTNAELRNVNKAAAATQDAPTKRGPGRPRKVAAVIAHGEEMNAEYEAAIVKRRGRPRKVQPAEVAPKRGRGRPRKDNGISDVVSALQAG